jgi:hypothetical protein
MTKEPGIYQNPNPGMKPVEGDVTEQPNAEQRIEEASEKEQAKYAETMREEEADKLAQAFPEAEEQEEEPKPKKRSSKK